MISASHARRFCIVLGMGIVLILAASATPGDDARHPCNPDLDAQDGAMAPSRPNVVDCPENPTAAHAFSGAEKLDAN